MYLNVIKGILVTTHEKNNHTFFQVKLRQIFCKILKKQTNIIFQSFTSSIRLKNYDYVNTCVHENKTFLIFNSSENFIFIFGRSAIFNLFRTKPFEPKLSIQSIPGLKFEMFIYESLVEVSKSDIIYDPTKRTIP